MEDGEVSHVAMWGGPRVGCGLCVAMCMSLSPHTHVQAHSSALSLLCPARSAVSGVLPRPRDRTPHRQCLLYHWHAARPVVRAMQPCASAHTPSTPRSSRCPLRSRPSITRPPHLPRRARRGRMPHARPHAPHPSRLAPRASRARRDGAPRPPGTPSSAADLRQCSHAGPCSHQACSS